jgi:hypothetical protein
MYVLVCRVGRLGSYVLTVCVSLSNESRCDGQTRQIGIPPIYVSTQYRSAAAVILRSYIK